MRKDDFFIVKPFNTMFMIMMGFFAALLIVPSIVLRHAPLEVRKTVLMVIAIFNLLLFVVYKYFLAKDKEYNEIYADLGGFNLWGELPLQLCNINMIFVPLALATGNIDLMSFAFFVGPLGAFMAVSMPCRGFEKYSIKLPRMIGFYGNHFLIIVECLALATFKIYRPWFMDVPRIIVTLFIVSFIIFLFNMFLRKTGLHPRANYFYNIETDGNPVLDLFWKWIPHPFLYQLPCMVVLAVYVVVVMFVYGLLSGIIR